MIGSNGGHRKRNDGHYLIQTKCIFSTIAWGSGGWPLNVGLAN